MKKYFIFALMGIGIGCGCYLSVSAMQTSEMNKSKVVETTVEPICETPVPSYDEEELYILSHLIEGEAGGNSWELKIGVGSVVLNRVADSRFPNTIADVVFQNGQYACTWDGNYDKEPCEESVEAAKYLLTNGSQMPSYVIFQAEFKQGNGVYDYFENTYFCYQED